MVENLLIFSGGLRAIMRAEKSFRADVVGKVANRAWPGAELIEKGRLSLSNRLVGLVVLKTEEGAHHRKLHLVENGVGGALLGEIVSQLLGSSRIAHAGE